jgi:transposase
LQALVAVLTGAYRLSKRQVQTLLADVFGIPLCAAQVCGVEAAVADLLQPVLADLQAALRTQPTNVDETSWREGVARHWVWVAVTAYVTVFQVAATRSAAEVHRLLGTTYGAVVTSDRYSSYNFLPLNQRQLCWAHLRRDFQALIDRGGAGQGIGMRLLAWSDALFQAWHNVRDGTLDQVAYTARMTEVRDGIHRALVEGGQRACARTVTLCQELLKREAALWTFLRVAGVEPTNNAAERALRHAVIWRKLSRGTASAKGSRYVATILSVVATCRQQAKNVLTFVTTCCQAAVAKTPLPSLLPQLAP